MQITKEENSLSLNYELPIKHSEFYFCRNRTSNIKSKTKIVKKLISKDEDEDASKKTISSHYSNSKDTNVNKFSNKVNLIHKEDSPKRLYKEKSYQKLIESSKPKGNHLINQKIARTDSLLNVYTMYECKSLKDLFLNYVHNNTLESCQTQIPNLLSLKPQNYKVPKKDKCSNDSPQPDSIIESVNEEKINPTLNTVAKSYTPNIFFRQKSNTLYTPISIKKQSRIINLQKSFTGNRKTYSQSENIDKQFLGNDKINYIDFHIKLFSKIFSYASKPSIPHINATNKRHEFKKYRSEKQIFFKTIKNTRKWINLNRYNYNSKMTNPFYNNNIRKLGNKGVIIKETIAPIINKTKNNKNSFGLQFKLKEKNNLPLYFSQVNQMFSGIKLQPQYISSKFIKASLNREMNNANSSKLFKFLKVKQQVIQNSQKSNIPNNKECYVNILQKQRESQSHLK